MLILGWPEFIEGPPPDLVRGKRTALTVGVFDGIHLGHQTLLQAILRKAPGLVPLVVTFRENPKKLLGKGDREGDILSLGQRIDIFRRAGLPLLVLIDFSVEFSKISGKEFLGLLQARGNPAYVALGSNFRCGYRMDAGAEDIRLFFRGAEVEVFESRTLGGAPISSSRIRAAIRSGDLREAAALLGRPLVVDLPDPVFPEGRDGPVFRVGGRALPPPGTWPVLIRRGSLPPESGTARIDGQGTVVLSSGGLRGRDGDWRIEFS